MAVEKTNIGCGEPNGLPNDICCMHIEASVETFLKLAEAFGWTVPTAVPA